MRARPLLDSRMLGKLGTFYPSICTIQTSDVLGAKFNSAVGDWEDLDGHDAIPCSVAALGMGSPADAAMQAKESPYTQMTTWEDELNHIALQGYYPLIQTGMRALVGETTYDIHAVEHDSHQGTTRLRVVVVVTP